MEKCAVKFNLRVIAMLGIIIIDRESKCKTDVWA